MGKANSGELVWQGAESLIGYGIEDDSASMALWRLGQVGERLEADFDLVEDLVRMRERRVKRHDREFDAILGDLGRIQAQLLEAADEVRDCLAALDPAGRNPSRALGLADSLVARLDLLAGNIARLVADVASTGRSGEDEGLVGALDQAAEEVWRTHLEASSAFLEIFEATW